MAESLAASIGWEFIEVRASDFLGEGMDRVPARADEIFDRLMELDHCVVLFDEIDELLRERQAAEADPFGRFLTTSMLPKVAELWKQRRVIFFVATNDIAHADRAIKRGQRFDAAIFVPPPSLDVKKAALKKKIGVGKGLRVSLSQVEEALNKNADENPLGYLALLRYDQLDELAARLRGKPLTKPSVEVALREIGGQLRASDWHHWPQFGESEEDAEDPFKAFQRQRDDQHRDYRMMLLVRVVGDGQVKPPKGTTLVKAGDHTFLRLASTVGRPPDEVQTSAGAKKPDKLLRYGHGGG